MSPFISRMTALLLLAGAVSIGVYVYLQYMSSQKGDTQSVPYIANDSRSIRAGNDVLVDISNQTIFDWFVAESQLCDESNMTTPERKSFCTDKKFFETQTTFSNIRTSPDGMRIGFTIESEALAPDTVVGIFARNTSHIKMLTNYYLGNEFIGFSPNGKYFVYRSGCFEALCALFVDDSETLEEVTAINMPEYADSRNTDVTFTRWISEDTIEYILGSQVIQKKL